MSQNINEAPKYANNVAVLMNKGGPVDGETTICFQQTYKVAKGNPPPDGKLTDDNFEMQTINVASVVMNINMACILRDALDNMIMRYEHERNNPNPNFKYDN